VSALLVFAAMLLASAGAGTLLLGTRGSLALRSTLGLALLAHAFFFLALIGQLRIGPIVALTCIGIAGLVRLRTATIDWPVTFAFVVVTSCFFVVALYPPLAFDETLYHLPIVRDLASSGSLRFLPDVRFPVFPRLHELLCAPAFLFGGDVATHVVALVEVVLTCALLVAWRDRRSGLLAAALFAGSPLIVSLATITYVDAALALFVAAGFYCLDRDDDLSLALSGLFLGTACSVKYLGGTFAIAALIIVIAQRRRVLLFTACCLATALPTTLWLVATTHNPVFPFASRIFGVTPWTLSLPHESPVLWRLAWDVTFARQRVGMQPPVSPFLTIAVLVVAFAAWRDVRARTVALIVAGYLAVFTFLPQDSRYLVALFPLISIVASCSAGFQPAPPVLQGAGWKPALHAGEILGRKTLLAALAVSPAIAYCAYLLAIRGLPPMSAADRERMLTARVPAYAALMRAGDATTYVCGGEQLKGYARGRFLGDFNGPYAYDRVLHGDVAGNLQRIGARYLLVCKRTCAPRHFDGLEVVYDDANAQLLRVSSPHSR